MSATSASSPSSTAVPAASDPEIVARELGRIATIRLQLLDRHPFWGYLLVQMRVVPLESLGAFAATDCLRHIWFKPSWTRHLSLAQLGFVLVHEICHQVLASRQRRDGRHPIRWNQATDYAINRIVAAIPRHGNTWSKPLYEVPIVEIPGRGRVEPLLDAQFDGLLAEAIYERLRLDEDREFPAGAIELIFQAPDGTVTHVTLPGVVDHGGGIDVHLPDLTPRQLEDLTERIRDALAAWQADAGRGHAPADLVRHLLPGAAARVPWCRLFRQFVGQAVSRDDYSLARPNRRYLAQDLVVPGLHDERPARVVVAIDTSGSMDDADLAGIGDELALLHGLVEELYVIVADARVHRCIAPVEMPGFLRSLDCKGGGGTSHVPVFEHIAEHRLDPDLFIGITDLESVFPDTRPFYPVVWLVPPDHGLAPWGRVIVRDGPGGSPP